MIARDAAIARYLRFNEGSVSLLTEPPSGMVDIRTSKVRFNEGSVSLLTEPGAARQGWQTILGLQ